MNDAGRIAVIIGLSFLTQVTRAQESTAPAEPGTGLRSEDAPEYLEVEKVKEKYWAQGEESQLGVVQNRLYSKAHKFHLGLMFGKAMNDPFLSTTLVGGNAGYSFNEFWALSLIGWSYNANASNALKVLRGGGKEANTIEPEWYGGAEATGSFLYGKLSLLGRKIVYYDMHFSVGSGVASTENDDSTYAFSAGIGQRFYITQWLSLKMDYRFQTYNATEVEKEITAKLGRVNGTIRQYNHMIGLELNSMFSLGGSDKSDGVKDTESAPAVEGAK
jgi:outer membrane beta-barrel protein